MGYYQVDVEFDDIARSLVRGGGLDEFLTALGEEFTEFVEGAPEFAADKITDTAKKTGYSGRELIKQLALSIRKLEERGQ